jgi:hypothetical protein
MGLDRSAHVPDPRQVGEDEGPAGRQPLSQLSRRSEPVQARQVDIQHGDVRLDLARLAHDLIAAGELSDNLDITFDLQQGHERPAEHLHVLGDKDTDHFATCSLQAAGLKKGRNPVILPISL